MKNKIFDIDFEGVIVKPDKQGIYRCPFNCSDKRYPAKKWKTEKGFRKHMTECWKRPSLIKRQREDKEHRKQEAMKKITHKIGDKIYYVKEIITKPTHVQRGSRMVKVRYEAEKIFIAREAVIESMTYNGYNQFYFNDGIYESDICESMNDAEAKASKMTKEYKEHCEFASFCR